jgi:Fur family transcriptional regulator, ferric uptake regulator
MERNFKTQPIQMSLISKTCEDFDLWSRRHGFRVTNKRRAVAEIVLQSKDYPDLDQLRSRIAVVNPRISLATVYNTLRLLVEFGLIERHKFRGSPARYGPIHQVRRGHLIDAQKWQSDQVSVQRNREPSR